MSTIQQLITDLTNLATDSRRKSPPIKKACDQVIPDLKAFLPTSQLKDAIITDDLKLNTSIPFILACSSGNSKLINQYLPVLTKLIVSSIVPNNKIEDVLLGLEDSITNGTDIQLRIIQCFPSLMQNYDIEGEDFLKLLHICSSLTTNNRSLVVNNTASATLQQLFNDFFDKISRIVDEEGEKSYEVATGDETTKVQKLVYEGFQIFSDLCNIITNEKLQYLDEKISLKTLSTFEIIENVIVSHKELFLNSIQFQYLVKNKLIPGLLTNINNTLQNFPLIVRTIRNLHVLLLTQLDQLEIESEIILSFLNHILLSNDPNIVSDKGESTSKQMTHPEPINLVNWEQILILEMYRSLFSEFDVIKTIFAKYDSNPKKKDVIQEILSIISNFLQNNSYIIITDVVSIPLIQPGSTYLSLQLSSLKISILDHLDKVEPPTNIPNTYSIYLVLRILMSFSEGISHFIEELSNTPDKQEMEANFELIRAVIESNFQYILRLFRSFLYISMDNETFHALVRSIQKFTHSVGLLGLLSLRDGLMLILSEGIIKNSSKREKRSIQSGGSSFQEQGKQLLAFGESLVESLSSTIQSPQHLQEINSTEVEAPKVKSRRFNLRQVICFRALTNLAISLGSTLDKSWEIVWITFQWVDFFINGPDEISGYFNNKEFKAFKENQLPSLSPQDLSIIEVSMKKLSESFADYPETSYSELVLVLSEKFDQAINNDHPLSDFKNLTVCPYNKSFLLQKLIEIVRVNPNKFLVTADDPWNHLVDFFIKFGTSRNLSSNIRILLIENFNYIILNVSENGFESGNDEQTKLSTSKKTLDGISKILQSLFNLGIPNELLLLNCETEIHLILLDTLHELIDKYDRYYQNSWDIVFEILNTSFRNSDRKESNDKKLGEKFRSLIGSSFDTLKLILDEFLLTLPYNQLKILIDTLFNFCSQVYNLNISFSSVSYFWLISDSVKSRIGSLSSETPRTISISDETSLVKFINETEEESQFYYRILDVYLLSSISKLTNDSRAQVRDGAIQTVFKIIDFHGSLIPSWALIYDIVLPILLDLQEVSEFEKDTTNDSNTKKEWIESLSLKLSALVSIYNKFISQWESKDSEINIKLWKQIIEYFNRLLELKWMELDLKVFKSFNDLILPLKFHNEHNGELRDLFYEFWSKFNIEYDFINNQYQEILAIYIECFTTLYQIIREKLTTEEIGSVLSVFNKCARYPILPGNSSDEKQMTSLQKSVMESLSIINTADDQINSSVVQQLTTILTYPFDTRIRIEKKLNNSNNKLNGKKLKIPSFVAISHHAMDLLSERIKQLTTLEVLLKDEGMIKLIKSLIEINQDKSNGIPSRQQKLWVDSNQLLTMIVNRLIEQHMTTIKDNYELWELLLASISICFAEEQWDGTNESINIDQYYKLSGKILPAMLSIAGDKRIYELIEGFVKKIYETSYLYKFSDNEQDMLSRQHTVDDIKRSLINYDFDQSFGSAVVLVSYENRDTRITCLKELIKFADSKDDRLVNISLPYFIIRSAYTIRRFIADAKLNYRAPLPRIQEEEVKIIVLAITNMKENDKQRAKLVDELSTLMIKMIPYDDKIDTMDFLIQKAIY